MLEKYIDLTEYGAEHDINRYLANGWRLKEKGLTVVILEKDEKTYFIIAEELTNALKKLVNDPEKLSNFETYLGYHFPEWLEKYANTPGKFTAEIKEFASINFGKEATQ